MIYLGFKSSSLDNNRNSNKVQTSLVWFWDGPIGLEEFLSAGWRGRYKKCGVFEGLHVVQVCIIDHVAVGLSYRFTFFLSLVKTEEATLKPKQTIKKPTLRAEKHVRYSALMIELLMTSTFQIISFDRYF